MQRPELPQRFLQVGQIHRPAVEIMAQLKNHSINVEASSGRLCMLKLALHGDVASIDHEMCGSQFCPRDTRRLILLCSLPGTAVCRAIVPSATSVQDFRDQGP